MVDTPGGSGGPADGVLAGAVLWAHPTGRERPTSVFLNLLATVPPHRLGEHFMGLPRLEDSPGQ